MKVSIIIPVYNVELYIETCLKSVLNQKYSDLEIIIVDDCGSDNSITIAENIINNYSGEFNIKIIHHSKNRGLSAARNTGIINANGDYLFFLDSDDSIPENSIKYLVECLKSAKEVDFVIGQMEVQGSHIKYPLKATKSINNNDEILTSYLKNEWYAMACNKLINKNFIKENNLYFTEGLLHEDEDFSFRLAYKANKMCCCYFTTYYYRINNNSITQNKSIKNYKDIYHIICSNFNLINERNNNKLLTSVISDYKINTLYCYIKSLTNENKISPNIKKTLISDILKAESKLKYYNKYSFKAIIKLIIIKIPFIRYIIFKYCKFLK